LFTSLKNRAARSALAFSSTALFCGIFSAVYEHFSHGVYSPFMVWLFLFPLLGGALPYLCIFAAGARLPGALPRDMWDSGVATLTVGSALTGVFEIYGTTAPLVGIYWFAGAALMLTGAVTYCAGSFAKRRAEGERAR